MAEVPAGCLGCNTQALEAFLKSHGFNPKEFEEVPNPTFAMGKVAVCKQCGKTWLIPELKPKPPK